MMHLQNILLSASADLTINFQISGHSLRVIELDGFPIQPKIVNRLMMVPGETAVVEPIRNVVKIKI